MIQLWDGASGMILYSVCGNGDSNEVFSTGVFAEFTRHDQTDFTKLHMCGWVVVDVSIVGVCVTGVLSHGFA